LKETTSMSPRYVSVTLRMICFLVVGRLLRIIVEDDDHGLTGVEATLDSGRNAELRVNREGLEDLLFARGQVDCDLLHGGWRWCGVTGVGRGGRLL
jgi:hypothetical protein